MLLIFLTGFVFYRLWSVLGTRTGNEKNPQDWFIGQFKEQNQTDQNNLVILTKKENDGDVQDAQDDDLKKDMLIQKTKELMIVMPQFDLDAFIRGACRAFETIIQAYADADIKKLKKLVTPAAFEKFEAAIQNRLARNETMEAEIDAVSAIVQDIRIEEDKAFIKMQFQSEQMLATVDENGQSNDNPARFTTTVIDTWTFCHELNHDSPIWLLAKTDMPSVRNL